MEKLARGFKMMRALGKDSPNSLIRQAQVRSVNTRSPSE
jgi:hypothetical protein